MRNENTQCHCKCESLNIKLGRFRRDERTKYVEHVLDVLQASRFAPDRPYRLLTRIKDEPTVDQPLFYDLTPCWPMPSMDMDYYKEEFIAAIARDFVMNGSQPWTRQPSKSLLHTTHQLPSPAALQFNNCVTQNTLSRKVLMISLRTETSSKIVTRRRPRIGIAFRFVAILFVLVPDLFRRFFVVIVLRADVANPLFFLHGQHSRTTARKETVRWNSVETSSFYRLQTAMCDNIFPRKSKQETETCV